MKKLFNLMLLVFMSVNIFTPTSFAAVNPDTLGYKVLSIDPGYSEQIFTVKDYNVLDGDTADFILDREQEPSIKARFLLIDAPELNEYSPFAKKAKERVEELFKEADEIKVEYEGKEKDRYQRDLVHVWVDGVLLSEILTAEGHAFARYIHDYIPNSKYAETIYLSQDYAERNGLGVWGENNQSYLSKAERSQVQESADQLQESSTVRSAGEYVDENGNGLIKGSSSGIYHVPGSTYYDRTKNPVAWFKTVEEAENAGYRAPKR